MNKSTERIKKLEQTEGAELFLNESKRRLQSLTTLFLHYKRTLGLIEAD